MFIFPPLRQPTTHLISVQVTRTPGTGTSAGPGGAPLTDSRSAGDADLPGTPLPCLTPARAAVTHLPAAHLSRHRVWCPGTPQGGTAHSHLPGGVCYRVRGDLGSLRTLLISQPLLCPRLRCPVPLRRQAGPRLAGRWEVSTLPILTFNLGFILSFIGFQGAENISISEISLYPN